MQISTQSEVIAKIEGTASHYHFALDVFDILLNVITYPYWFKSIPHSFLYPYSNNLYEINGSGASGGHAMTRCMAGHAITFLGKWCTSGHEEPLAKSKYQNKATKSRDNFAEGLCKHSLRCHSFSSCFLDGYFLGVMATK